jgi:site-specific recombinase XerD
MSRTKKRERITPDKKSGSTITIREVFKTRHGSRYVTHLVQGWKEDGKWKRREFKDEAKAKAFKAKKDIEILNTGRPQGLVLSSLTEDQQKEAENAVDLLGGVYSLTEAVEYFMKNHRAPGFTIQLWDASHFYLEVKENEGLRPRTLESIRQTLERFANDTDNPEVHEVGGGHVRRFLTGLRSKDGVTKATRRSWNIHRSNLDGFFKWCSDDKASDNHPFTFSNPVEDTKAFTAKQVKEEQADEIITTEIDDTKRIFDLLIRWKGGVFVPAFALLYFAGIRPAELPRLAAIADKMINRKTGIITIPASVSKTKEKRTVYISDNLAAWLDAFPFPIIPPNFKRQYARIRKHFALTHDEARHSFISYHIALNRSVGDAALQAGNSEAIVKKHYLNTHTKDEGADFFSIVPDMKMRRAVPSTKITHLTPGTLKAV